MKGLFFLMTIVLFTGCSTDKVQLEGTLESVLESTEIVVENVIACAASNENDSQVSVFFYPRDGASNFKYFETESAEVDENDFSSYSELEIPSKDIFNGYLKKFEVAVSEEKWVIVTFEEDGKTHLSNPIRLKQITKPTEYLPQNITVDASSENPDFSWVDGTYDDTKIYFQVISDPQQNLISGTYTFDRMFRFYELDNVVLNITRGTPPALKMNLSYAFTLMGVSEDNWVNQFSVISFDL
ncbi:hypothetical protein [Maribacter halichondriae]|uniref:hypothetical protein n=1 Tax=Maribacter halichondriae TaxID=2980554 RepID=UPI00235849F1|nr:hypothetical protein [Maribacter sp. Hal144]